MDQSSLVAAGAAVAGTIVGGLSAWLLEWERARHTRADARDERRRTAYAACILAQEELRRVAVAWKTATPPPAPDSRFGDAIAQATGAVDRASVMVDLVGPSKLRAAAIEARVKAWDVYRVVHGRDGHAGEPVIPRLAIAIGDYIDACDKFAQSARDTLDR